MKQERNSFSILFTSLVAVALAAGCACGKKKEKPSVDSATTQELCTPATSSLNKDFVCSVGNAVYFDFDKSMLTDEAKNTLTRQAEFLKSKSCGITITVHGGCDERGTREYNDVLGQRRAQAVKDFLCKNGIDQGRITVVSNGKDHPIAQGCTEEDYRKNRYGITILDNPCEGEKALVANNVAGNADMVNAAPMVA